MSKICNFWCQIVLIFDDYSAGDNILIFWRLSFREQASLHDQDAPPKEDQEDVEEEPADEVKEVVAGNGEEDDPVKEQIEEDQSGAEEKEKKEDFEGVVVERELNDIDESLDEMEEKDKEAENETEEQTEKVDEIEKKEETEKVKEEERKEENGRQDSEVRCRKMLKSAGSLVHLWPVKTGCIKRSREGQTCKTWSVREFSILLHFTQQIMQVWTSLLPKS